ncbi:hypothetical protein Y032_0012g1804 [Ancylostoma ceylanicum]|uniref:Uncharacterized protein n=2 Tax=Ancylostoma ceylanicum TaxID=53326 RepID=A0A016VDE0_9BILA|nr:hypothetical protein Y032_0012g1804 [Ancylostoma ceylanicum]
MCGRKKCILQVARREMAAPVSSYFAMTEQLSAEIAQFRQIKEMRKQRSLAELTELPCENSIPEKRAIFHFHQDKLLVRTHQVVTC